MASSFAGTSFSVVPNNGFFPNPDEGGGDDPPKYECDVFFLTAAARDAMLSKVGRGTAHRIYGTRTWNWHGESGTLPTSLTVPKSAGVDVTFTRAVMRGITNVEGFGRQANQTFKAHLEFWILSDLTP